MIRNLVLTIVFTICIFSFSSVSAQLFGGQIKSNKDWAILYPAGSVFCASGPTAIVDVTNPITGKIWMDRNLGATQAATSSTDAAAYGDLYQWGRRSDGHQCRTSANITTLSSVDQPANGNFIKAPLAPNDWRSPQNANLWQGVNGVNIPCPSAYRLPTDVELNAERLSWSVQSGVGAFASALKLPMAGSRNGSNGSFFSVGTYGSCWSSMVVGVNSRGLGFYTSIANIYEAIRADGAAVRCIKETVATVGSIDCGNATQTGLVYSSQVTSGVSISLAYTGGNGGFQATQIYTSTGVTGLTATLTPGLINNGSGNFIFTIAGIAFSEGTANFVVSIGGQTCSFTVTVQTALAAQYPAGSVFCASGPTAIVDVTNPTTGKIWMDRNLGASQVATSSTDVAAYGDLYQWGRRIDGHQCRTSATTATLSSIDQPVNGNFILSPTTPFDWRSPQNNNLWQGVNGVNNPCPNGYRIPTETELNSERLSWNSNNSIGAFSSILKFTSAGSRSNINGALANVNLVGDYWSSNISSSLSIDLDINNTGSSTNNVTRGDGVSVRCIKDASAIPATLGAINCGSSSITGTLTSGAAASGVSASVPYTGGNGGSFAAQTIPSTSVTGLTANLAAGVLANGSGSLSLTISGTPSASGTASFALSIGGQSCSFTMSVAVNLAAQYPAGSVFCTSGPTAIVDVTNPTTGKIWMDRNLGASQAATSATDASAYGDLFQWGRGPDGHQCRNSATTTTLSSTDQPGNGNFILTSTSDWRSTPNGNLWQGVNGINNPCPSSYRLPTQAEFNTELQSWTSNSTAGAFGSVLKLPSAGGRLRNLGQGGAIVSAGTGGVYWTSTTNLNNSVNINFGTLDPGLITTSLERSDGNSVRCIKN